MCVKFFVWLSKANKTWRRIIKIFVFFSCTLYYNYSLIIYLHLLIACLMQALIHHRFSMSEFWHRNTGCFVYLYYFTQNYDRQNIIFCWRKFSSFSFNVLLLILLMKEKYISFRMFSFNTCSKLWIVLGTCHPAYDWLVLRFFLLNNTLAKLTGKRNNDECL